MYIYYKFVLYILKIKTKHKMRQKRHSNAGDLLKSKKGLAKHAQKVHNH